MNNKPVWYLQTDPRWSAKPYRVPGETATIGGSGCGPTSAAMAIESITGKTFTPEDACAWSVAHGHKAKNAGTYYNYFVPQFAAFNIECKQMPWADLYHNPSHPMHQQIKDYVNDGYYAIACMGPGRWTKGGHYILIWDWDDKVRINDSASKKDIRLNGDPAVFTNEVKHYWIIDAREYNCMTYEKWKEFMEQYRSELAAKPADDYARASIKACIDAGLSQNVGTDEDPEIARPNDFMLRQDVNIMFSQMMNMGEKNDN